MEAFDNNSSKAIFEELEKGGTRSIEIAQIDLRNYLF